LLKQISAVTKNPELSICFTNTLAFDGAIENELYNFDQKEFGLLEDNLFNKIYTSNYMSNSSILFKKAELVKVGFYNENEIIRGSEDWELLLRLLFSKGKAYGLKEKLFYYRVHDGGIHLQNARMFIGKVNVYKNYASELSIPALLKLRQYRYTYRELLNYLYLEGRHYEINQYLKELWELDPRSFVTLKQKVVFKMFSIKNALWISNKIIYRIGYRIESLNYKLFLR
jgi:hypothetical protein